MQQYLIVLSLVTSFLTTINAQQSPYEHLQKGEEAYNLLFDGTIAIMEFKLAIDGYKSTDSLERQAYAEYMLAKSPAYLLSDFNTTEKQLNDFIEKYQNNPDSSIQRWHWRALVALGTNYGERNLFPQKEIQLYEKALKGQLALLGENHQDIANTYNEMHYHYKYQGNVERELFYAKQSLVILEHLWQTEEQNEELKSALGDAYNNYASALGSSAVFSKLEAYQKAIALSEEIYPDDHPALAVMYANLASSYSETGDLALAVSIMEKAMTTAEKKLAKTNPNYYAQFCVSYAEYQELTGNTQQAGLFYEKALALIQDDIQEVPPSIASFVIRESSHFLINQQQFEKATDRLQKALEWIPKNSIHEANLWRLFALIAFEQGDLKTANETLQKAKKALDESTKSDNSPLHNVIYRAWAEVKLKEKDNEAAVKYATLAIQSELPDWGKSTLGVPKSSELFNDINLLQSIHFKAKALFNIGKQEELIACLNHVALLDSFAINLKKEAITAFAEQFLVEEMADVYRLGTETALLAKNNDLALEYAEKSRGGLLEEALLSRNNKTNNQLDSLWGIEMQLREQIAQLEQDTSSQTQKNTAILALQALHQQNPHYAQVFNEPSITTDRQTLQEQLKKGQVYIEYLVANSHLLAFCLTNSQFFVKTINTDSLKEKVLGFYKICSSPSINNEWKATAYDLYTQMISPVFNELQQEAETLIIVPDQYLNYLPFEALLIEKEGRFLIEQMPISYAYGFRFLNRKNNTSKPSKTLLSVAPLYSNPPNDKILAEIVRSGYFSLQGAQDEAKAISTLYHGDLLLGEAATKMAFLKQAKDYQILHLAMHALLDDDQPANSSLVFTQQNGNYEQLYNYELYGQEFNADLVVLSACNTGNGEYLDGEGLIGLSKGFAFAGIPSTLTSLWKVPDQETRQIMEGFYAALKKGMLKNEALQSAKLHYLAQNKIPQLRHPYYWSGFVLMGDTAAITPQSIFSPAFWIGLGAVALFGVLFVLIRRRF